MKKKAVIADVDLTLVGDTHFDFSQAYNLEYLRSWHVRTLTAKKLTLGVDLVRYFHATGFKLVVMTARDTQGMYELKRKLVELEIYHMFDHIMMRTMNELGLSSSIVKARMIDQLAHKYNFMFAMDDANHDMYRERGIKIFDANNWNK